MEKFLEVGQRHYRYIIKGEGPVMILLHGYLESVDIWGAFAQKLSTWFKVVLIDLPGHGKSSGLLKPPTVEGMASVVDKICEAEDLSSVFLTGHSMGGYVTLAFLEKYSGRLSGFSLLHSHPFADSEETLKKRDREIQLVRDGKKSTICAINIPNAFAPGNLNLLSKKVEMATEIARNTKDDGMIDALQAMQKRPDRSELLRQTKLPFLWVLGRKDLYISYQLMLDKGLLPSGGEIITLENSGHQGFMEEEDRVVDIYRNFFRSVTAGKSH